MVEAAKTKEDLADLINVALEELAHGNFELPPFDTLDKAAHHARAITMRGLYCHLSTKNYRFPDNLPRCQAPSGNRLSHRMWRGIGRNSFSFSTSLFRQTRRLVRQDL